MLKILPSWGHISINLFIAIPQDVGPLGIWCVAGNRI